MGTLTKKSQQRTDFDAHKVALIPLKGVEDGITCQKQRKKKTQQKRMQGPLWGIKSDSILKKRGAGLPCVDFKNRSTGKVSLDRSEPSPRFASNGIHMKSGADNLQGNGFDKGPARSRSEEGAKTQSHKLS